MAEELNYELLKQLPKIDDVLADAALQRLARFVPADVLADEVRAVVAKLREAVLAGGEPDVSKEAVVKDATSRASRLLTPSLKRVINASGVIIHTNLGRSVLAPAAQDAVNSVICGYSNLEYSIDKMARGSRHDHCENLICALTGAEAAIAVNNNAAAVMMVLSEFAEDRQAIVSRGELVEIGGSFRIPDVMAQSHAITVEVGTTNKTHARDYERAINDETAMLLKVHTSNYRLIGFTESVDIATLRKIADKENETRREDQKILVYEDQGSGALVNLEAFGNLADDPIASSLRAGADLVSFSGDKLLGGPQAGIIVGSKRLIDRLKSNPLARIMRLDKMTLAALEATLRIYLDPELALKQIPTLRMLTETPEEMEQKANQLMGIIRKRVSEDDAYLQVVPEISRAGGGALPMYDIETFVVEVSFIRGEAQRCEEFLVKERPVPIVGRIRQETLLLDPRTIVDENEMKIIAQGLSAYFKKLPAEPAE